MKPAHSYSGRELDLFARAQNWKSYYGKLIGPHLGSDVLEVGAGIGSTAKTLCTGTQNRWLCLEPDASLFSQIRETIERCGLPKCCDARNGNIADLEPSDVFNSILYIDVLEHIKNDQEELVLAASHLKRDGTLIVLAPAHGWLYSAFDEHVGHHRRYTFKTLSTCAPPVLSLIDLRYLDSVGLLLSLGNAALLKRSLPARWQIEFWDRFVVPVSEVMDRVCAYRLGKSVLAVWRKNS